MMYLTDKDKATIRDALEALAKPGYGLQGIFEDYPNETIDKYYAAYKYYVKEANRKMAIANKALALLDAPQAPTQDAELNRMTKEIVRIYCVGGMEEAFCDRLAARDAQLRSAVVEECKAVLDKYTGLDVHCKDGWGVIKLSSEVIATLNAIKGWSK